MSGAAVSVQGVSRRFKLGAEEVWALREVGLDVPAGQFLALIGRSGSGKTTLLNIIAGLDRPTEGDVLIDGRSVPAMSERELTELRRHTLGFVFQSFGLLPLLSAYENVELPLRIAGVRHGERARRARRVLEMVGLGRRAEHRPYELSGGEQQRVAIARALAIQPRLILADEPTGELDSSTAVAIFTLMRDIARSEGVTIITSTHDRLVIEMADRVEELANGRHVEGKELLRTVTGRERSPFAAPLPAAAHAGEALTVTTAGAGTSPPAPPVRADAATPPESEPDGVPHWSPQEVPHSRPTPVPPTGDAEDDVARWAPPERR